MMLLDPMPAVLKAARVSFNAMPLGHPIPSLTTVTMNCVETLKESHQSFSAGMDGQGNGGAIVGNRFMVYSRNRFTGGNGILLWGLGNKDCLVGGNHFINTEIAIGVDQFPVGKDTVINYVLYNNTVV
jgi:hypothetical protein